MIVNMDEVILNLLELPDPSSEDLDLLKTWAKENPKSPLVPRIHIFTKNDDIDEQAIRKIIYNKDLKLEDSDLLRSWIQKNPTSKLVPIINKSIKRMENDNVVNIMGKKSNVTKDDITFLKNWSENNPKNDLTNRVSTFIKNNNKKDIVIKNYDYEDFTEYDNDYGGIMDYANDDDYFSDNRYDYFNNNRYDYINNNIYRDNYYNRNANGNCTCPNCIFKRFGGDLGGNNAFYQDFDHNIPDPAYERGVAESLKPEYETKKEKIADDIIDKVMKDFKEVSGDEKDCSICLCECDGQCVETACEHTFHTDCIKEWLEVKLECPVCKNAFGEK